MLPEDLGRGVALDAFGADVPAHHVTARIEQIDRVVGKARDEQAKQLIGRVLAAQHPLREPRVHFHGETILPPVVR
jgi:hypothetical protein